MDGNAQKTPIRCMLWFGAVSFIPSQLWSCIKGNSHAHRANKIQSNEAIHATEMVHSKPTLSTPLLRRKNSPNKNTSTGKAYAWEEYRQTRPV